MTALLAGSAVVTCLGTGAETFDALLDGRSGLGPLRRTDAERLSVSRGYHIADDDSCFRAGAWLTQCVRQALDEAEITPQTHRIAAVIGTGLRELRTLERWEEPPADFPTHLLHFGSAARAAEPALTEVVTVSNACSAGGHALAMAQDMLDLGEADAVVVGATDEMSGSMLTMIGRVAEEPTEAVRPFDADRGGVLLGEGAAAVVLVAEGATERPLARVLATGVSCDAHHETAPSTEGLGRAVTDALRRGDRTGRDVDLVVAHGTGTALNDPAEARVLLENVVGDGPGPLVTALKGAIGHTSGASALHNLDVAIRALRHGRVPPVVGLRHPLPEGEGLRFAVDSTPTAPMRLAQIDAFGFGGVNTVTLLEAV
ncbi:beta-ketoacyl synthase N-terminal-like domain-containing protein [Salinactinospora qingdaonensis]|uniref:Beta-ketoacyl-[acyl-carrier-protein] synthase family protein n=1 Tax=Salinactinospora qingdaonensis TaxID=702744 RepID=A0ABP7FBF2_9ACTN